MLIKTDSRKIEKGDIFVSLTNNETHINEAIKKGAKKIINANKDELSRLLKDYYYDEIKHIKLIGVTGTNGKTTTAFLIYQALNKLNIKTAYIGTIGFYHNDKIEELDNTTPDLVDIYDMLIKSKDCDYVVMEVSSHALEQKRLLGLEFDYAIFTNLTQDHLDYHKTMNNYMMAKKELFNQLKEEGKALINNDDKYSENFTKKDSITFGESETTYQISNIILDDEVTKFKINDISYETTLLGKHNVYNLVPTIIILENIKTKNIQETVKTLTPPKGRLEIIKYNTNKIIIDYAHTPDAVEKIIEATKSFAKGNIYTIIGCGGDRDKPTRPIMAKVATDLSEYVFFTSDNPRSERPDEIIKDMIRDLAKNNYEVDIDREKSIEKGVQKLVKNDILLVLGKGHEPYQIINDKKLPFDDKEIVFKYI